VDLARSDVPVMPDELDASPDLLNTESGTIDLRTGDLREHRREDLITKIAPTKYWPDAAAPTWEAFLERVLPGEELRAFVQRAVGYSATGDTSEQCMFINHGGGANGKSTFQEAIAAALGDYAMRAPTEMLLAKRSDGVPNDVARMKGARFVSASETEEGRRLAESRIKDLTGQDTITARFMKAEWFDFAPTHKLWLSTNHKPEIRGTDAAIWRRIRLVPWAVTIPPVEQDKKLPIALRDELAGILAWVVRGCLQWRREGLQAPDEVRKATGEYRVEMDVLAGFLAECCELDTSHWEYAKDLYECYKRWCDENGERPEPQRKFGGRLGERGFQRDRGGSRGAGIWRGVRLTEGEKEALREC
jgi:putative DNA primase/helicase